MWCWQDVGNKMKGSMTLFPVCCVMSRVLRGGIFHGMCSNNSVFARMIGLVGVIIDRSPIEWCRGEGGGEIVVNHSH